MGNKVARGAIFAQKVFEESIRFRTDTHHAWDWATRIGRHGIQPAPRLTRTSVGLMPAASPDPRGALPAGTFFPHLCSNVIKVPNGGGADFFPLRYFIWTLSHQGLDGSVLRGWEIMRIWGLDTNSTAMSFMVPS